MKRMVLAAVFLVGGCSLDTVRVAEPTSMRPQPLPAARPSNGAIFDDSASFRPLFEDRRARYPGDTLTIVLNEKLQASRNASSSASRTGELAVDVPVVRGLPGKSFQGAALEASTVNRFEGKGGAAADNVFTGTITVTVLEVLANGNLAVSGEKRIGIAHNSETLRFSGIVNPATILAGNTVSSAQIADARIDYRGSGYIDEAQTMGWLGRFFLTVLPF
jgi:flagellar L-ring protein precursor FlgH